MADVDCWMADGDGDGSAADSVSMASFRCDSCAGTDGSAVLLVAISGGGGGASGSGGGMSFVLTMAVGDFGALVDDVTVGLLALPADASVVSLDCNDDAEDDTALTSPACINRRAITRAPLLAYLRLPTCA